MPYEFYEVILCLLCGVVHIVIAADMVCACCLHLYRHCHRVCGICVVVGVVDVSGAVFKFLCCWLVVACLYCVVDCVCGLD